MDRSYPIRLESPNRECGRTGKSENRHRRVHEELLGLHDVMQRWMIFFCVFCWFWPAKHSVTQLPEEKIKVRDTYLVDAGARVRHQLQCFSTDVLPFFALKFSHFLFLSSDLNLSTNVQPSAFLGTPSPRFDSPFGCHPPPPPHVF